MESILFTVIVPVYNVESFLPRCLDSILEQTYKGEFETIIVNDGSTDNCPKIIQNYKKRFKHVKIINRENKGLLYSRVEALKQAKGKYIVYVDSDDYLPNDALEIYSKNIEEYEYDIIRGNYYSFDQNNNINKCDNFTDSDIIYKEDIIYKIYNQLLRSIKFNSVWRQAIKKQIIAIDEIDTSINMGEDLEFNQACYNNITSMKIITNYLYYYRINNKSMTHDVSIERLKRNIIDLNKVYDDIIRNIKEYNDINILKQAYCSYLKTMNAYFFFLIKHAKDKNTINEFLSIIMLNEKTQQAKNILKFKDIKFKNRKIFIYLIMKNKRKIYILLLKIISIFL